ncbi:outer membrane protein [Bartonella raoultii]|uniref:outer membrane protein n=1 Tax=Bartonella raoultii TaxID=1457020 RepID=UPI0035312D13
MIISEQPAPVIAASAFSWTGFYLGGQVGNFSGKTSENYLKNKSLGKWNPVEKRLIPKLSGFIGGIYAGSNIDINNGCVIGIDTDIMWGERKDTKDISFLKEAQTEEAPQALEEKSLRGLPKKDPPAVFIETIHHTLKQKWTGATRVKLGFSVDRFMPYVAGGISYTQLRNSFFKESDGEGGESGSSDLLHDEKKTMIGYTLGGGIDFAMTDNIIMRAEYRYSDFGKKKFVHDKVEMGYKTNDFRVGLAYKF